MKDIFDPLFLLAVCGLAAYRGNRPLPQLWWRSIQCVVAVVAAILLVNAFFPSRVSPSIWEAKIALQVVGILMAGYLALLLRRPLSES